MTKNNIINFDIPLLTLDGTPFKNGDKDFTLGSVLAPIIAQSTKGDALKLFGWALSLYKKESLNLDQSDQNTMRDFIKNSEHLTILAKAQLLNTLDKS